MSSIAFESPHVTRQRLAKQLADTRAASWLLLEAVEEADAGGRSDESSALHAAWWHLRRRVMRLHDEFIEAQAPPRACSRAR